MRKKGGILGGIFLILLLIGMLIPQRDVQASEVKARVLMITGSESGLTPAPQNDQENFRRMINKAYPDMESTTLRQLSTVVQVKEAIAEAFAESDSNDINYFYYSGHGNSNGLALYSATMKALDLAEAFEDIKGKNILVIDCCYAGALALKGARSAVVTEEEFLDSFMAEFEEAVTEENTGKASRSALTNSRFKLLLASSAEELSWQWSSKTNEYSNLGLFTTSLTISCGINAYKLDSEESGEYVLGKAAADLNQDGSISLDEIYTYIENANQMSHVRVYPRADASQFLPISEQEVSDVAFKAATVSYEDGVPQLELFYQAKAGSKVSYQVYFGDDWGVSYLIKDLPKKTFTGYAYTNDKDGLELHSYGAIKTTTVSTDKNSFTAVLPDEAKTKSGDYVVVVRIGTDGAKYILPFNIKLEGSSLGDSFSLMLGTDDQGIYIPADEELEITADFGVTYTEDVEKPLLSCYILDEDENVIRTLGENEWMQVVGTGFDAVGNMISGNCYRKFHWDGKDDNGQFVTAGIYNVKVISRGAVEAAKLDLVTITEAVKNITLSDMKLLVTLDEDDKEIVLEYQNEFSGSATIEIVDVKTNEVKKILKKNQAETAGISTVEWNGKNSTGEYAAEGDYFFRIKYMLEDGRYLTRESEIFKFQYNTAGITNIQMLEDSEIDFRQTDEITLFSFTLKYNTNISACIYDESGEDLLCNLLTDPSAAPGNYEVIWDGNGDNSCPLVSGQYHFVVKADSQIDGSEQTILDLLLKVESKAIIDDIELSVQSLRLPLMDGENDLSLTYQTFYAGNITVQLLNKETDQIVATLVDSTDISAQKHTNVWNGKHSDGTFVEDGTYYFELTFNFDSGTQQVIKESDEFVLSKDMTGVTDLQTPRDDLLDFSEVNSLTVLEYTLKYSTKVTVEIYDEDGEKELRSLKANEQTTKGSHTITWDGNSKSGFPIVTGRYRLIMKVMSPLDETEQEVVNVLLDIESKTAMSEIDLPVTELNLPLQQGVNYPSISFETYCAGDVSVYIKEYGSDRVIKTLKDDEAAAAGKQTAQWDGKLTEETYAEDGDYYFEVQFTFDEGNQLVKKASITFTLNKDMMFSKANNGVSSIALAVSNAVDFTQNSEIKLVNYTLDYDTKISAAIYTRNSEMLIRTLKSEELIKAGEKGYSIAWDGKQDNGTIVGAGEYRIVVTAISLFDRTDQQEILSERFQVDEKALISDKITLSAATLQYPSGTSQTSAGYKVEYAGAEVTVSVVDTARKTVKMLYKGKVNSTASQTLTWNGTKDDGTDAPAGKYYIQVQAAVGTRREKKESEVITLNRTTNTQETNGEGKSINPKSVTAKIGNKTVKMITLGVKEKVQLNPVIAPTNATDKTVKYKSGNTKVATITAGGKITAKKKGTAKITITTKNGVKTVITVNVKKAPGKVSVQAKSKTLKRGKQYKLKVKLPSGTASYKTTYSSSKKKVASVDSSGVIKALKKGKATITVKTFNGKKVKIKITVK